MNKMGEARKAEVPETEALLPCPFCGHVGISVCEGSTFRWRYAMCDNCGAQAGEVRHNTLADDQAAATKESHAEAIKEWNTRAAELSAQDASPKAEVERLNLLVANLQSRAGGYADQISMVLEPERDRLRTEVERLESLLPLDVVALDAENETLRATVAEQGAALAELREVLKDLRDCAAQDLRHPQPTGLLDFRIDELTIFKRADAALASVQS
jgi:Lar family restriction alleviation protein